MNTKIITHGELQHVEQALERAREELQIQEELSDYTDTGAYELIEESLIIVQSLLKGKHHVEPEDIGLGH